MKRIINIRRVFRFIPVPVLTSPWLPGRIVGLSLGVAVIVRTDYADDEPTVVHELKHCEQFFRTGGLIHFVRYFCSRTYRLKTEVEAFKAELDSCNDQLRHSRIEESAAALSYGYGIGLSADQCKALLIA